MADHEMRSFLEVLFNFGHEPSRERRDNIVFWQLEGRSSLHVPYCELATASDDDWIEFQSEMQAWSAGKNTYVGHSLRVPDLEPGKQGGKKDTTAFYAVLLDVDLADNRAHKSQHLPTGFEEAAEIIDLVPVPPTWAVDTGYGLHLGWGFHEPVELQNRTDRDLAQKACKAWQRQIIDTAKKEYGYHVDLAETTQRVWRLVGTENLKKQESPQSVRLLYSTDQRYDPQEVGIGAKKRDRVQVPAHNNYADQKQRAEKSTKNHFVSQLREKLTKVDKSHPLHYELHRIAIGASFADPGERDEKLQKVCSYLAWIPQARDRSPEELAEVLRPSLKVWADEPDAEKTLDQEMEKAIDKIERSVTDYEEKKSTEVGELAGLARGLGVDLEDRYPDGKVPPKETKTFLRHLIVQCGRSYYVWHFGKERYVGPYIRDALVPVIRDAFEDGPDEASLEGLNEKGGWVIKTHPKLMNEYGVAADELYADMRIDKSFYDPEDNAFHESIARPRKGLKSKYDPEIDEWLKTFTGSHYDDVCDWIAALPQTGRQLAILYLDGPAGTGKTLLTTGLAHIWPTQGPVPITTALGKFNNLLARCPLIEADEGLGRLRESASDRLRAMTGRAMFQIEEKNVNPRMVRGCVRLIVAANNPSALFDDESLTANDLEAIAGRILHVPVLREARELLDRLPRATKEEWMMTGIAQHALHLAETRKLSEENRFVVGGNIQKVHKQIVMQGGAPVFEWLSRFMTDPKVLEKAYKSKNQPVPFRIGNGDLMINTQCVIDGWEQYIQHYKDVPTAQYIGRALNKISIGQRRLNGRQRFHVINPDLVISWGQQYQIGDEISMRENIDKKMDWGDDTEEIHDV